MTRRLKLPCGCWGEQREDGLMTISAESFTCSQHHRQGAVLTPFDIEGDDDVE